MLKYWTPYAGTLFTLMVVNNWYIIMVSLLPYTVAAETGSHTFATQYEQEGFASEVHPQYVWLTRIYFMSFYIIKLVNLLLFFFYLKNNI